MTFKGGRRKPAAFTLILTHAFSVSPSPPPIVPGWRAIFLSSAISIGLLFGLLLVSTRISGSSASALSSLVVSSPLGYLYLNSRLPNPSLLLSYGRFFPRVLLSVSPFIFIRLCFVRLIVARRRRPSSGFTDVPSPPVIIRCSASLVSSRPIATMSTPSCSVSTSSAVHFLGSRSRDSLVFTLLC